MNRQQICQQTARKLSAAIADLAQVRCLIGLDGFVDEIIGVVDKWTDLDHYQPVPNIAALAQKVAKAAGQSSNYELVVKQMKLGGNGPIMANALAAIGLKVTYLGNLGYPTLHPVFAELARRAEEVFSIAEPGHTDALEFEDGKLMLGKLSSLKDLCWDNLLQRVGRDKLQELFARSSLVAMMNWTMLPYMSQIWTRVIEDILPRLSGPRRKLFIDLADPEKRTADDIRGALKLLGRFQQTVDVTLGLNLKESMEIVEVLGLAKPADAEAAIAQTAGAIRQRLDLECVVIHPRGGAAAATASQTAAFAGPFVRQPRISTGAGDHFNAGFATGRALNLSLEECLCVGVATSGFYVRQAQSPSAADLAAFIADMPQPEQR